MKNNPNLKYYLISLVIIIWGLIIYKILNELKDDDIVINEKSPSEIIKVDTSSAYILSPEPYADPFKNKVEGEIEDHFINKNYQSDFVPLPSNIANEFPLERNYQPPIPEPVEPPPSLIYKGYIYNPQTRKKTAIITYNGKTMVVGIADKLDEKTKVVNIEKQQLTFSFSGKRVAVGLGG